MSRPNMINFPQPQLPTAIPTMVCYSQPSATPAIRTPSPAEIPPSGQAPPPSLTADFPAPASSSQHSDQMYKNRLQEFVQKLNMPLPVYETVNEGFAHAPKFRSSVLVDGEKFTSPKTFWTRKAAEKAVAELALVHVSQKKTKEDLHQDLSVIRVETVFCKSILHELASKTNLETPTYNTVKSEASIPIFISSLVFNGVPYTGGPGKNKKEAEQLAARAVITSILADSMMGKVLREIIKSKGKRYAAFQNANNQTTTVPLPINVSTSVHGTNIGTEACTINSAPAPIPVESLPKVVNNAAAGAVPVENVPQSLPKVVNDAAAGAVPVENVPPSHVFKLPMPENLQATNLPEPASARLPIEFVPPTSAVSMGATLSSSKRRRKNKKKTNKRLCTGAELPVNNPALNQAPSCSVALTM